MRGVVTSSNALSNTVIRPDRGTNLQYLILVQEV
jgi:hypothetical protein